MWRHVFISILLVKFTVQDYPFRNVSLSWDERVNDLVGRLTLEEITLQMAKGGAGGNGPAPAISRLGINPYQWNTECLHGDVGHNATAYPQSIGLAATFSTDVIFRMAEATAVEVRATHNAAIKNKNFHDHTGLSCFAPVINIMRDPRWGRNQETYGEDPYLNGMLSAAYVKGLQGDHPRYVRANAGCKHFNVHGGPDDVPVSRFSFNSEVSMRDWRTTFLPAFRYCVEAGTYSLMCSYNRINGVPACANPFLLTEVLRNEWGFKGYVVSDEVAIENIITAHHYLNNSIDTAAACVNAGCNLELGPGYKQTDVYMSINEAVKQGKLTESLVRERVKPLFYTRMRLGEFDPPSMNPYASITTAVIEEKTHRDLAEEAAMKSFVLLKNDGVLPLKGSPFNNIAIIGPMANNPSLMSGDYQAFPDPKFVTTPLQSLASLGKEYYYASGCNDTKCRQYSSSNIQAAVSNADVVFICIGLGTPLEAEGNDRHDIELPGHQAQLIMDAVKYSGSAKIVLITLNAGPVNITWADSNPRVSAIIAAFYPGQATGVALSKVILGEYPNAFGRLPYTWFSNADQVPAITNYTMIERTYKYTTATPLYQFGWGLTYSQFFYNQMDWKNTIQAGDSFNATVKFNNVGPFVADEVVQVYLKWTNSSWNLPTPNIQLVQFQRLTVPIGSHIVNITISPQNMAAFDVSIGWVIRPGTLYFSVGGQQPDMQRLGTSSYIDGTFNIQGEKILGFY